MVVKYLRTIDGRPYFAGVEVSVEESSDTKSIVRDRCNWNSQKASYDDFELSEFHKRQKEVVLDGMNYGLSKVQFKKPITIDLSDLLLSNTDTSLSSLFAVGVISIFEVSKIDMTEFDLLSIDRFVSEHSLDEEFDQGILTLGNY